MGSLKLALEIGAPKRLELTWGLRYSKLEAKLDGHTVVSAPDTAELKKGISGRMPDGATLSVTLKNNGLQQSLVVLRDGQPVPGSSTHPLTQVKNAAYVLYFIAAATAVFGLIAASNGGIEVAIGMWVGALIYAVLGFFALRPSFIALAIGMVMYVGDGYFSIAEQLNAGRPNVMGILVRAALLVMLFNGAQAARSLKKSAAVAPATQR